MSNEVVALSIAGTLGGILLLVGLLTAYAGFVIYQLYLWAIGFVLGAGAGGIFGLLAVGDQALVVFIVAVIGGFIGGGLIVTFQVLLVAGMGFFLTVSTLSAAFEVNPLNPLVLLAGIIVGIIGWKLYVVMVIALTASVGAMTVSFAMTSPSELIGGVFWVIFLTGMAVQGGIFSRIDLEEEEIDIPDVFDLHHAALVLAIASYALFLFGPDILWLLLSLTAVSIAIIAMYIDYRTMQKYGNTGGLQLALGGMGMYTVLLFLSITSKLSVEFAVPTGLPIIGLFVRFSFRISLFLFLLVVLGTIVYQRRKALNAIPE